jgi:hypothetical protein
MGPNTIIHNFNYYLQLIVLLFIFTKIISKPNAMTESQSIKSDNNSKYTKKTKLAWGAITLLIALSLIFFTPLKWHIYLFYQNLRDNHFTPGDKMYAANLLKRKDNINAIGLFRLIRPSNSNEKLDGEYVIGCDKIIYKDSLVKYKTTFIGKYINHRVLNLKNSDNTMGFANFYEIQPNTEAFLEGYFDQNRIPKGYTWVNNSLYVISLDVTYKEEY